MFESETANSEPAIFESVRKLYSSCMDQDQIEKDGRFLILQKIQELGGWPVLRGPMNADTFVWQKLVETARKIGLPAKVLLYTQISSFY